MTKAESACWQLTFKTAEEDDEEEATAAKEISMHAAAVLAELGVKFFPLKEEQMMALKGFLSGGQVIALLLALERL